MIAAIAAVQSCDTHRSGHCALYLHRSPEMRLQPLCLVLCVLLLCTLSMALPAAAAPSPFPADMLWGASTAAYQVEGSWNVSDKQASIWDVLTHSCGGCVANNDTGDVADDSYRRYAEDTELLANLSLNAYRFSISWPRIITADGKVNAAGLQHYSALIDGLLARGIAPVVTLYHGDLPYAYDTQPGSSQQQGWHNATYLVPLFLQYATACFTAFGQRVKHWITLNEPRYFCELYGCGHTAILVHANTVRLYRQMGQDGVIGMVIDGQYNIPLTDSAADVEAAERAMIFDIGWLADPLFFGPDRGRHSVAQSSRSASAEAVTSVLCSAAAVAGDYPQIMKDMVGSRLPSFTAEEKALLQSTKPDFFFLNTYTSGFSRNGSQQECGDSGVCNSATDVNGTAIGPRGESPWLYVYPPGIRGILHWVWTRYQTPLMVTENGVDVPGESKLSIAHALEDQFRVDYYRGYLGYVQRAVEEGVDLRGYFAWSLLDNFEWNDGYTKRFGLHYVDYNSPVLARYPKRSAQFYSQTVAKHKRCSHSPTLLLPPLTLCRLFASV